MRVNFLQHKWVKVGTRINKDKHFRQIQHISACLQSSLGKIKKIVVGPLKLKDHVKVTDRKS